METIDKNINDLKILFSEEELNRRIKELAGAIEAVFPDNETIYAVCVLKGSVMFFISLLKHFKHNVRMEFIRISSYGNEMKSSRKIQAVDLNLPDLKDKNVLIVEDIIDTGLTAEYLINMFKTECRPKKLVFTALCNKKCARAADIEPDFYGFEIGSKFIAGFGMDYKGYFRNLPYIGWFPQNEKE